MSEKKKRETYKVSPSLINSYLSMRKEKYQDSYKQFIDTLNRVKIEPNYFLKRGNAFEEQVMKYKDEPFYNIVSKCDTQMHISKDVILEDEEFDIKIVGFIDFISKDKKIIYDTKRVNYWDNDKYDDSFQHDFYLWAVPESEKFYYLVGAGKKWRAEEYFQVEYSKESEEKLEEVSTGIIKDFIKYLKENNLLETYKKHYNADSSIYKKNKKKPKKEESN